MTENDNRVVVTGLGMITSIGKSVTECFDNAIKGVTGIKEIKNVDTTDCYSKIASEVDDDLSSIETDEYTDRAVKLCIHALNEAMDDSNLSSFNYDTRVSVIIGNCVAGVVSIDDYYRNGKDKKNILQMPMSCIANQIAYRIKAGGVVTTIANACAAGTISISYASDLIREGKADIVICGGCDAFSSVPYAGFLALHAMDSGVCSPFNHTTGINLGEGSGILILESYEHAKKRDAKMYCEVLGSGISTDAHHITAPREDGEGQMNAINWAINNSGIDKKDIGYVNAHGTGTHKNDYAEFLSLKTIFGENNKDLSVSSTKAMVGHCLGAAGSIEAIFAIKALNSSLIPPTLGFSEEDKIKLKENAGEIDFVPNVAKKKELHYVMNNSFAFGGNNASIIFSDKQGEVKKHRKTKACITGFGIVSPLGNGIEAYIEAIKENKHVEKGNVSSSVTKDDFLNVGVPMSFFRKLDTVSQLETLSGVLALKNSNIEINDINATRIGIVDGTSEGAMGMGCLFNENIVNKNNASGSAFNFPNTVYNAAAGYLSIFTGIKGYNVTITNGCQSGLASIYYASDIINFDREDVLLCSGSDENISVTTELATKLDFVADKYVKPYSNDSHFVLSDGATTVILEKENHAKERNAKIYSYISGTGMASYPVKFGTLKGSSLALDIAIKQALDEANLKIEDISCISGFANGKKEIDDEEITSYKRLFKNLSTLPIINSKTRVGESRASAALLSAIDASLLLKEEIREMPCYYIGESIKEGKVESKDMKHILVTSYGSGGIYTAIILSRE